MTSAKVHIRDVWKVFRGQTGPVVALEGVSLDIREGEANTYFIYKAESNGVELARLIESFLAA